VPQYQEVLNDFVPGPYVDVRITNGDVVRDIKGILDTGSDVTVLPAPTVEALKLQEITDDVDLYDGSGGVTQGASMYTADIEFEGYRFEGITVATTNYAVALIGRDILNDFVATFDGPELQFNLVRPS
jgi:predicted aspartyl protease